MQEYAQTNRTYKDDVPVPFPGYRCPSTARDTSKKAHTHLCKITVDHMEDHACICGREWKRIDDLAAA